MSSLVVRFRVPTSSSFAVLSSRAIPEVCSSCYVFDISLLLANLFSQPLREPMFFWASALEVSLWLQVGSELVILPMEICSFSFFPWYIRGYIVSRLESRFRFFFAHRLPLFAAFCFVYIEGLSFLSPVVSISFLFFVSVSEGVDAVVVASFNINARYNEDGCVFTSTMMVGFSIPVREVR